MIDPIIEFFDKLVTKFSWPRMIFIIVVFALAVAGVFIFELYTGHFRLARIEAASNLLDKLISQSKALNSSDKQGFDAIHQALIVDLRSYTVQSQSLVPTWFLKCLAAAAPWVLLSIFMLRVTTGPHSSTIGGIVVFSIPFIVIGGILPDMRSPWLNYAAYPVLSCLLVVIPLAIFGNRKKVKTDTLP